MLFNKSLNRDTPPYKCAMRGLLVLPLLSVLAACATPFTPGDDRVLFSDSSAQVGPVVTSAEQYPVNDNEVSATTAKAPIVDSTAGSPEPASKSESDQNPATDTDTDPNP